MRESVHSRRCIVVASGPCASAFGWTLLLAIFSLFGCAHTVPITETRRSALRSVSVSQKVVLPDQMYYSGKEDVLALAAGVLGGGAVDEVTSDDLRVSAKERLVTIMKEADIDMAEIARQEFERALVGSRRFETVAPEGGDAHFELVVLMYGLAQAGALASELKPLLSVSGKLVKADGTVIWQDSAYVTNVRGQTSGKSMADYLRDPEQLRRVLTQAAGLVAKELVTRLSEP